MRILVIFVVLVAFASAEIETDEEVMKQYNAKHDYLNKLVDECGTEIGLSKEETDNVMKGDYDDNDRPSKCFLRCYLIKQGFFNENNEPDKQLILDSVLETFPESEKIFRRDMDKCLTFAGSDLCQQAAEFMTCMRETASRLLKRNNLKKEKKEDSNDDSTDNTNEDNNENSEENIEEDDDSDSSKDEL